MASPHRGGAPPPAPNPPGRPPPPAAPPPGWGWGPQFQTAAPRRRTAGVACELLRLARTAGLRLRARAPVVAHPRRARLLLRHRAARLVAARPRRPAPARVRRACRVRLRDVRPRRTARAPACTPAAAGLRLLRRR